MRGARLIGIIRVLYCGALPSMIPFKWLPPNATHQGGLIALLTPLAADVERRDAAPQIFQQLQQATATFEASA